MIEIRPISIVILVLIGSALTLLGLTISYRKDVAIIRELNPILACVSVVLIIFSLAELIF